MTEPVWVTRFLIPYEGGDAGPLSLVGGPILFVPYGKWELRHIRWPYPDDLSARRRWNTDLANALIHLMLKGTVSNQDAFVLPDGKTFVVARYVELPDIPLKAAVPEHG